MYINPFLAGILSTVFVEFALMIISAILQENKGDEKDE